ncbi:LOW QUALITY PROTEIN: putative gap junction epsilon-1 protein [Egretta garzetta]|uniref:LOW QUALITY PROTEIN: putative gap junction epsilon-1 protein n=1 Tax=Egretta garzetta TaxID=188379 RepID=UPI00163C6E37|nr:LOW QUALITY PROTEIN: putative gap junction epsilon-1 protein [Egretta garzetta]
MARRSLLHHHHDVNPYNSKINGLLVQAFSSTWCILQQINTNKLTEPCDLQLRPPTVIGQSHTLLFGSVCLFSLGVLGFAVHGNEALHFSREPDKREVNLPCYNQFRPITPQVFWALQMVIALVPGAFFHLYAACKSIKQKETLQKSFYTIFLISSVFLRIILEAEAFLLQIQLFGFKVNAIYVCDVGALEKQFNVTRCMLPEHFEKRIFLIAMYKFTVITVVLCVATFFEISCRRLGFLKTQ